MNSISTLAILTVSTLAASDSCRQLNDVALTQTATGHWVEAEALLSATPASGDEPGVSACTGLILGKMAKTMSILGHIAEAERFAEQSVRILEKLHPPNDPELLRPLQTLAAVRLELGMTGKARDALKRIQPIRVARPDDRVIVHVTNGALLQIQGRRPEAEAEYLEALRVWDQAELGASADAASIFHCLAALYLEEERLGDARSALDRALAIHNRAPDVLPADRIKFLDLRAVLHARLGEWQRCEQDLRDALAMADRETFVYPAILRWILENYSHVLRRNHHGREARSIETRRKALPPDRTANAIVDLAELRHDKKTAPNSLRGGR